MKTIKNALALILIIVLSVSFCACGNSGDIKTVTNNFEKTCNELDVNGMLDCIDPTIASGVKALTGLVGLFTNKDTDELLDSFAKVLFNELPENSQEFFSSINIKIGDIEIDENEENATAQAEISYEISGETYQKEVTLEYICVDGEWYISSLDF